MAPELQKDGGRYGYGKEQEIWALGMLLLEMLTHYKPEGNRKEQIVGEDEEDHYRVVETFGPKA